MLLRSAIRGATAVATCLAACGGERAAPPEPEVTDNPQPTLSLLSPAQVTAGSGRVRLTASGSGFIETSVVRWKGLDQPTTFESERRLHADIAGNEILLGGFAAVTVFSPAPGGGVSDTLLFTITNPIPLLTAISPSSAVAGPGGPGLILSLEGQGFGLASLVQWNGAPQTAELVSPTMLTAFISSSLLATPGKALVWVVNPAPGGGTTDALRFRILPPPP